MVLLWVRATSNSIWSSEPNKELVAFRYFFNTYSVLTSRRNFKKMWWFSIWSTAVRRVRINPCRLHRELWRGHRMHFKLQSRQCWVLDRLSSKLIFGPKTLGRDQSAWDNWRLFENILWIRSIDILNCKNQIKREMKIICAGYPKTGSKSCSTALRHLG